MYFLFHHLNLILSIIYYFNTLDLALATASISSINIIHGAFFLAFSNNPLTLFAPKPTNISTKSEPDIEKNGTSASPATAFANNVLPVPGGPDNIAPY